ncbi:MAG: cytochrome P450 [Acidimicrobiales bacterium]
MTFPAPPVVLLPAEGRPVDLRRDGAPTLSIDEEHKRLAVAREHHPWGEGDLGPVLLRHADVAALLHDRSFAQAGMEAMEFNGVTEGPLYDWWSQIMFTNEGEAHARLRNSVRGWLTPKRVAELAGPVRTATEELVAGLPGEEPFDLAGRVADPVPITAICALLGVDPDRVAELGDATTELGMAFGFFDADERHRIEAGLSTLLDWGEHALADARPGTLARSIAEAGASRQIGHDEAVALIANLLFAAHDTTRFLIANAFWELGRNPDVWGGLVAGTVDAAEVVEETLRFQPPAVGTVRIATEPARIAGLEIEAGRLVSVSLRSAGRDPRVYEQPDRFVPGRRHGPLLAFGHGVHHCIGASLARLEATVVLTTVAAMCPDLRIDAAAARQREGRASITGIEYLPARLS